MALFKKQHYYYIFLLLLFFNSAVFAEMRPVSDAELDTITGQYFSNFEYTEYGRNGTTFIKMQIDLNMDIEVRTKIDQVRLGHYYYGGTTGATILGSNNYGHNYPGDVGWNIDIQGLQVGEYNGGYHDGGNADVPFRMEGLTIRTDYEISGNNKILTTFAIGSDHCYGMVYADYFRSFSGAMSGSLAQDSGSLISWLGDVLIDDWAFRTYLLNGVTYTFAITLNFNIGRDGMTWNNNGMYLVIDKEIGVGLYAGFPIDDLLTHWVK